MAYFFSTTFRYITSN